MDALALHTPRTRMAWIWMALAALLAATLPVDELAAAGSRWMAPRPAAVDPTVDEQARSGGSVAVIVQGQPGQAAAARDAVERAGGIARRALPIIDGLAATVPAEAVDSLKREPSIRALSANHAVRFENVTYDEASTASNFAKTSGATSAWGRSLYGTGVGVAVIDTGISSMADFGRRVVFGPDLSGEGTTVDTYGHGTVMAGLIGGSGADSSGRTGGAYTGVAPDSTLVSVKAAGRNGATDVSTMLQAMHWVSAYKSQFNIRVLSLSWGTKSTQDPALDPLNYAVQRLWQEGIVVVVAAGNSGPNAGTITKPGDDPVALTVGAFDDKGNTERSDDSIPSWSSRGPTAAGLAKPDVVAPGRTLVAARSFGSSVEANNPKALISPSYIKGSGTSQATAVTAGLAALLLQARPELTPDQVKAILRHTAAPLSSASTTAQGMGRVDLAAALAAPAPATAQTLTAGGMGSIEASRGGMNVESDCDGDGVRELIKGEMDVRCQAWDPGPWTGGAWTGGAWTGGAWTGGAWTGGAWTGGAWTDATWTGGAWTGGAWTGGAWTGGAWTGGAWTGGAWTGGAWTGAAWTGGAWTAAEYGEDLFLTAFFGSRPKPGAWVAGEQSEPVVRMPWVGGRPQLTAGR